MPEPDAPTDLQRVDGHWLSIREAAQVLKTTEAAVRQMKQRKQVLFRTGPTGKLEVLVSTEAYAQYQASSLDLQTPGQPDAAQSYWLRQLRQRDILIGRLQERVRNLTDQLTATQMALTTLAQRQLPPSEGLEELNEGEE